MTSGSEKHTAYELRALNKKYSTTSALVVDSRLINVYIDSL